MFVNSNMEKYFHAYHGFFMKNNQRLATCIIIVLVNT